MAALPKAGDRVRVVRCTDPDTFLRPGTTGTAFAIDDAGILHVEWDDGSRLGLVPGEDEWEVVPSGE